MPEIELFANNAVSTLASDITDSGTSITLQTGDGALFPNPGAGQFFYATLVGNNNVEIVKVTARSTDTLTVVRGQQGTSGFAWTAGTEIGNRLTRDAIRHSLQYPNLTLAKPPGLNSWATGDLSNVNLGSATLVNQNDCLYMSWPYNTVGAAQHRVWYKSHPTPPYTIVFGVRVPPNFNDGGGRGFALYFRENTSGELLAGYFSDDRHKVERWNSPTSWNGTPQSVTIEGYGSVLYLALAHDGTNVGFQWLPDGKNPGTLYREAAGTFLTPDQVGFGMYGGRQGTGLVAIQSTIFHVEVISSVTW